MRISMIGALFCIFAVAGLSGCSKSNNSVRITATKPQSTKPVAAAVPQTRSNEPIFYNGKTYRLDYSPVGPGVYGMKVKGMSAKQQKDAVAVATSSLRYFACPDGKSGHLTNTPGYTGGVWAMSATCK